MAKLRIFAVLFLATLSGLQALHPNDPSVQLNKIVDLIESEFGDQSSLDPVDQYANQEAPSNAEQKTIVNEEIQVMETTLRPVVKERVVGYTQIQASEIDGDSSFAIQVIVWFLLINWMLFFIFCRVVMVFERAQPRR